MLVMILILVLMLVALGSGGWGYPRYGWKGMSPVGLVLIVLAILYFAGYLSAR